MVNAVVVVAAVAVVVDSETWMAAGVAADVEAGAWKKTWMAGSAEDVVVVVVRKGKRRKDQTRGAVTTADWSYVNSGYCCWDGYCC